MSSDRFLDGIQLDFDGLAAATESNPQVVTYRDPGQLVGAATTTHTVLAGVRLWVETAVGVVTIRGYDDTPGAPPLNKQRKVYEADFTFALTNVAQTDALGVEEQPIWNGLYFTAESDTINTDVKLIPQLRNMPAHA